MIKASHVYKCHHFTSSVQVGYILHNGSLMKHLDITLANDEHKEITGNANHIYLTTLLSLNGY